MLFWLVCLKSCAGNVYGKRAGTLVSGFDELTMPDRMAHSKFFPPHGKLDIRVDGRILVLRAEGPWNAELTRLYTELVEKHINALAGQPWALLGFVVNEGIHTPDSYAIQLQAVREHRQKGRVATAVVFERLDSEQFVRIVFDKLYNEAGEPHAFFDNEAAACAWLEERLREASAC